MEYIFDGPPDFGETKEVAHGLHWLRMPLPMALDHINLWLVEDGPGWTLIDTGLYSGLSKQIWTQVIDERLDGRPLNRVICTHFHPDHVGMAGWLVARTGAEFWMPRTEWLYARMLTMDTSDSFTDATVEYYRRAGGSAPTHVVFLDDDVDNYPAGQRMEGSTWALENLSASAREAPPAALMVAWPIVPANGISEAAMARIEALLKAPEEEAPVEEPAG